MTGRVNEHMDEIRGAIGEAADQVGYTITGGLNQTLDDGTLAYYDKMFDGVTSVNGYLDTINKTVQEMAAYSAQIAAAAKHEDEHPTGKSDEAVKATEEAVKLAVDEINGVHTSTGGSGGGSGTSAGTGTSAAETGAGGKDWAKAWEERNPVDMHEALIHAFGEKGAPAEKHELDIGNAKLRVDISEDKMDIKFTDISNPNKPRYQMAYTTYKRMKESGELAQRLYDWLRVYEDVSLDDLEKLAMPFRSGGLADYTGTAILHGTKQRPELVLNADDTERFLAAAKLMRAPVLSALLDKSFRMPDVGGTNIGDTTVNLGGIYIERVDDADDLVNQLRNNRKFEELIHIVTDGRYMGGQRYDKYLGGR